PRLGGVAPAGAPTPKVGRRARNGLRLSVSDRETQAVTAAPKAAWAPLRRPLFRALWTSDVVSSIGTWMHDAAAAWLMTLLAPSPLMVSLVQAANTLPLFLLALPAGALADVLDRRRI